MKSKNKSLLIITTAVCMLPIILSALLYNKLPGKIPIHFNSAGAPDNYLPKALACFGLPAALSLLNLFVHFRINNDPKKANASELIKMIGKWCVPALSVIFVPLSLFISLGNDIPIHVIAPALVGILILVCGNYLPKSRQNYTIGIKLPWTLSNEDNWNKTHHMAGIIWVIGGLIILVTGFLQWYSVFVILVVIAALVVVPFIYSYFLYKKSL